jgi:soluble lytic murein transglycosylase-like protein
MLLVQGILIASVGFAAVAADGQPLTGQQVYSIAYTVGSETGIEPELLIAIAKVESNFNPKAIGRSHGEVGLMQLRPEYFPNASFIPKQNMELAAKYLVKLKKLCSHRGAAWYTCFNTGPNAVINHPRLLLYYKRVESARRQIQAPTRYVVQDINQWGRVGDILGRGR